MEPPLKRKRTMVEEEEEGAARECASDSRACAEDCGGGGPPTATAARHQPPPAQDTPPPAQDTPPPVQPPQAQEQAEQPQRAALPALPPSPPSPPSPPPPELVLALDTETTGLNYYGLRPTEIAIHDLGDPAASFAELIHPGCRIPPKVVELTGITDALVASARSEAAVLADALAFVAARARAAADAAGSAAPARVFVVAHNAAFDRGVLEMATARSGLALPAHWTWIDTVRMSQKRRPTESFGHKLTECCPYFRVKTTDAHRAAADARMCGDLYRVLERGRGASAVVADLASPLDRPHPPPPGGGT